MQLVDANVLLYAVNSDAPHHVTARSWLDTALGGNETVAFSWAVLLAFLRLSTRPGVFRQPLTLDQAADIVELWLAQPAAIVTQPTGRHLSLIRGLLSGAGTSGNLVTDAHLAALALEHGAEIVSFDRGYQRFDGIRWRLPATT